MKDSTGATGPATPELSVVMPVHEGERYLEEALASVMQQRFEGPAPEWELVVVNDGSTDGSGRILAEASQRDARVRVLEQVNAGVSAARNAGIAAARGRYLMFLDQDDRFTRSALQTHLAAFAADPGLGYTLAHQVCFLEPGSEIPAWFALQKLAVPVPGYLPGTLCVRREVFAGLGVFDLRYPISSDADWFARARDAAVPMRLLEQVTLERRIHSQNQSRHSATIHRELAQLLTASIRRKRESQ